MNIKSIATLLLIAVAFIFTQTSCIETTTETTLKADGSGTQTITVDMSKIISQMGAMMFEGEEPTEELFKEKMGEEMMGKMDSMRMAIDTTEGISNFNTQIEGYTMIYSYDFEDLSMIEKLKEVNDAGEMMGGAMEMTQKGSKSTLSWSASLADLKKSMGADGKEVNDEMLTMMRSMFEGMEMTSIFHFPGPVKKISDKEHMRVSKDKRTVIYAASLVDFIDGKLPDENSITYKSPKK